MARVDKIKEQQQQQQAYGMGKLETVLSLIETASNVWNKVSTEFEQKQSTIADKSNDRPTNDSDSRDKSGKSCACAPILPLCSVAKAIDKIKAADCFALFSQPIYCSTIKFSALFLLLLIFVRLNFFYPIRVCSFTLPFGEMQRRRYQRMLEKAAAISKVIH